jgi:hypothetical protein
MELTEEQVTYRTAVAACLAHDAKLGWKNPDGSFNTAYINESFRLSGVAFAAMSALLPPGLE